MQTWTRIYIPSFNVYKPSFNASFYRRVLRCKGIPPVEIKVGSLFVFVSETALTDEVNTDGEIYEVIDDAMVQSLYAPRGYLEVALGQLIALMKETPLFFPGSSVLLSDVAVQNKKKLLRIREVVGIISQATRDAELARLEDDADKIFQIIEIKGNLDGRHEYTMSEGCMLSNGDVVDAPVYGLK
jgi:hypothetical protein